MRSIAKKAGHLLHAAASSNSKIADLYLSWIGRISRSAPDGRWKQFLSNSIHSVEWPNLTLKNVTTHFPGSDLEVVLRPHLNEFDFQAHLYRHILYEAEVFRWLADRSYLTVVDIGANIGLFSLYFAKRFPDARVYAFEPSREAFGRLLTNAAANQHPNLFIFNCAICSESGLANFHEPSGHLTNGSLDPAFASSFSKRVVTSLVPALAASTIKSLPIRPPFLVKIDVEGSEPQVLQSLAELIADHKPDLLIEVLPVTESALNCLPFLKDGSYRRFSIRPEGAVEQEKLVAAEYRDYALLPA